MQQELQGVLAAGGNHSVAWLVDRILATGDNAVGQAALTELYQRMRDSLEPADLDRLWRELLVATNGMLNDAAPLAAVRRAIQA